MTNGQPKGEKKDSGQELKALYLANVVAWAESTSDDDFREYVYRGSLNRKDIHTECGFRKSVRRQLSWPVGHPNCRRTITIDESV